MQTKFKTITIQNLMAVGDNPFVIQLDRSPTTHVSGKNGTGKSTLLVESVFYALFGKSFRGLTLDLLINDINLKGMKVVLEFERNGKNFVLTRGHKPKIFTLEMDGQPVPENAKIGDLQANLENILGYDAASFIKVVTIGHANYRPFLKLTAAERRVFVDYSLNTEIFTMMAKQAAQDVKDQKALVDKTDSELAKIEAVYKSKLDIIEKQKESTDGKVLKLKEELAVQLQNIAGYNRQVKELNSTIPDVDLNRREVVNKRSNDIDYEIRQLKRDNEEITRQITFYEVNTTCPTCQTEMTDKHREDHLSELRLKQQGNNSNISTLDAEQTACKQEWLDIDDIRQKAEAIKSQVRILESNISNATAEARRIGKQIEELSKPSVEVSVEEEKAQIQQLHAKRAEQDLKLQMLQKAQILLKDTGVKTAVISKYLPIFNQYVNQYLDILEFPQRIRFDENFKEQFIGRYVGEKNYESFSQGERERIDLALMFAWRSTIAISTGANTNLLVLDEIGGSSLDEDGIEGLFRIVEKVCDEQNVFIISHRVEAKERCRSSIHLKKKDGFTRIVS